MSNAAMIVISGFEVAGQTTLASRLATYYAFPVLSTDATDEATAVSGSSQDALLDCGSSAQDVLFASCRAQLANDVSIIVNSPTSDAGLWPRLCQICEETGTKLVPIVAQCDFMCSLDFPHHEIDACQEPDAVLAVVATIIDTALDLWEAVECGDSSGFGA